MIFGEVATADALGALLAHGLRGDGFAFKKGRRLVAADLARLTAAGHRRLVVARLEPGDVPEDEAAEAVARALAGPGVDVAAPFTGRVNLYARDHGLVRIDAERIHAVNLVDESVTVATLPPFAAVVPGQMLATVKIIPFAAPEDVVGRCRAVGGERGSPIDVAALRRRCVGLVQTRLSGTKANVLDRTASVLRARVEALGSTLAAAVVVDHEPGALATAIAALLRRDADPVLVLGASAIVDRRDTIPAAVTALGGEVLHFGMPVDPGNLLLLARVGAATVLGLPGCARSPKLNGLDWVLQRLLADIPVGRDDVMRMGVGGMLTEIPTRPMPRDAGSRRGTSVPRIAAVVLAAGTGSRMPDADKLLLPVDGRPLVLAAVDAALDSRADPVVVVVGHRPERIRRALGGRAVTVVENGRYAAGLGTSVAAGIETLPADVDGAVILLADMPRVTAAHVGRLIAAFSPDDGREVCVPTRDGVRGNPVLWGARFFPALRELDGDRGGRALLDSHPDALAEVEMPDDAVLVDVDVAADAAGLADDTARRAAVAATDGPGDARG